jgi:hypothetical protein
MYCAVATLALLSSARGSNRCICDRFLNCITPLDAGVHHLWATAGVLVRCDCWQGLLSVIAVMLLICVSAAVVLLTGLSLDDPYVVDTLAEEVPAMIKLQHHILLTSDWRLFVSEQQLQHACSMLEIAGSSSSSGGSLDAVQDLVQRKAQQYQEWRDETTAAIQSQKQQQPAMQLFPGEVVMGMLTAVTGPAEAAAEEDGQALYDAAAAHEAYQPKQQQRWPLQEISNVCDLQPSSQPQDSGAAEAPFKGLGDMLEPQQQQQQQPRTRQQHKLFQQRKDSEGENPRPVIASKTATAAAAGPSGSRQAKSQLLQLASREQAVGSKRRHSMPTAAAVPPRQAPAAAAAAGTAAAGEQGGMQEQQQGGMGVLGAGGKRILLRVMRTARSAAHYLGCVAQ